MGYIGKEPSAGSFEMLDDLTASATATYALQKGSVAFFPGSANQLIVSLNGVVQEPGVSFTIAGSNIVFSSAPPAGTNNIQVTQLARANTLNTVANNSIGLTQLNFDPADDATALAIALG